MLERARLRWIYLTFWNFVVTVLARHRCTVGAHPGLWPVFPFHVLFSVVFLAHPEVSGDSPQGCVQRTCVPQHPFTPLGAGSD